MFQVKTNCTKRYGSRLSSTRTGFSLIEIIVVMALMVTVGALAVPAMVNFFSSHKLAKAADKVRTEMGRARVEAIRSGDIYAFYFRPEMTSYTVAPFSSSFNERLLPSERKGEDERGTDFNFDQERLPRGVIFAAADSQPDARVAQTMSEMDVSLSSMRPILFYPDGTSQSAVIVLQNEQQELYKISLRGLTGSATANPYSKE